MEQRSIRQVAAWANGRTEAPDRPLNGVTVDSRAIVRDDLFVALQGDNYDGHDFLGEAFASGAGAALVDRPGAAKIHQAMGRAVILVDDSRAALARLAAAHRRALDLKVVGITGSNGKTTTKEMLKLLLPRAAASPKSFNNEIGVPLTLLAANDRHEYCICEIGSNAPGEIAMLSSIAKPDVGIVLNIGESHLQGLGDLNGVAEEKFNLVESLGPDGCAILNWDDERTRAMIPDAPGYVLSFGTWTQADVFAAEIRTIGYKLSFKLLGKRRVNLDLIGVHNVHNALAACSAALWLGHDPNDIADRIEAFAPAPMRMAVEQVGQVRLINDAYNANPRSMRAALAEIGYRAGGRRIAVLGDMHELGKASDVLHAEVGRDAAKARVDVVWAIGPKSERIAQAARDAGVRDVHWSPDVMSAQNDPKVRVRSRDVVLFKASRAMRLERLYDTVKADVQSRRRTAAPALPRKSEPAPSAGVPTSRLEASLLETLDETPRTGAERVP